MSTETGKVESLLVTGGSGLAGKAIQEILHEFKHIGKVTFLSRKDGNLRSYQQTRKIFATYRPSHVIHLAAVVGGLFKNMRSPVEFLQNNIRIDQNILQLSHEFKVRKLVCVLSTCIFPDQVTYPITEDVLHAGPPNDSNSAYAYGKRLMNISCEAYRKQYGDPFVCVIPTNLFGKNDNYDLKDGHVVANLIQKAYDQKYSDIPWILEGSGKPLRQFLYANDFARLLIQVLLHYDEKEPIILSPPEEYSIHELGLLIADIVDTSPPQLRDADLSILQQKDGQFKKTVSTKKLLTHFPTFAFTPLRKALEETIAAYIQARQKTNLLDV